MLVALLLLFLNPLAVILLLAAAVSGFLGQVVDAAIIIAIVIVGNLINFFQTWRSQKALERLREQVMATATVLRDGVWTEWPRRDVVPGDVIRLSAGDLVPADSLLLEAKDLHVQQAALTGESLPVEKQASAGQPADTRPNSPHMVFMGTNVVSGTATALVAATGRDTAFGNIAERLSVRPEETEFERGIREFGALILKTVFFLVSVFARRELCAAPQPAPVSSVRGGPGRWPDLEFLPMITSVTLAQGAVRMARSKVIVKHLASIQNFGSIDVLCSDKTGMLTSGSMKLDRAVDWDGTDSEHVLPWPP